MQPFKPWKSSCSGNTQKSNVQSFLFAKLQAVRFNFHETGLHKADLLENFAMNILSKVWVFKVKNKGKTPPMQACNLLKMETSSNDFQEILKIY